MTKLFLKRSFILCWLLICSSCYGGKDEHIDITYPNSKFVDVEKMIGPDESRDFGIRVYVAESVSTLEMKFKVDTKQGGQSYKGYTASAFKNGSEILSFDGYGCVNKFGVAMFILTQNLQSEIDLYVSFYFTNKDKSRNIISINIPEYRAAANKLGESGRAELGWFGGIGMPLSKASKERFSSNFDCL